MDDLYIQEKRNGPKVIAALVLYVLLTVAAIAVIGFFVFS